MSMSTLISHKTIPSEESVVVGTICKFMTMKQVDWVQFLRVSMSKIVDYAALFFFSFKS